MIRYKTLVNIDRLAYPIYGACRVFGYFFRKRYRTKYENSDNVVVIKMLGIGSITRIFTSLRKNSIDLEKIEFYTLSGNKELCEILEIRNVQFIEVNRFVPFISSCLRAIRRMRNQRPMVIVDYERSSNLLGVFRTLATAFTATKTVSFYNLKKDRHTGLDFQYKLFDKSMKELIDQTMIFLPSSTSISSTTEREKGSIIPDHSILVNINASDYMPHRKYSRSRYAEVITSLLNIDKGLNIFLVGATDEKAYVDDMIQENLDGLPRITNCCGLWSLKELISALDTCRCLITNDSGPMHLAVMRGVKTIAIWGPTTPSTFGYEEHKHVINIQSGRSCAPCFIYPKSKAAQVCNGRIDCMMDIEPQEIVKATSQLLSEYQLTT